MFAIYSYCVCYWNICVIIGIFQCIEGILWMNLLWVYLDILQFEEHIEMLVYATDLHTHELPTGQSAYTFYHNKMCPLHRGVLDKNSEAESHSHTLPYPLFLQTWAIGTKK